MNQLFLDSEMADNSPFAIKPNDSYITRKAKTFSRAQTISNDTLIVAQSYEFGARAMLDDTRRLMCMVCHKRNDCNGRISNCEYQKHIDRVFGN